MRLSAKVNVLSYFPLLVACSRNMKAYILTFPSFTNDVINTQSPHIHQMSKGPITAQTWWLRWQIIYLMLVPDFSIMCTDTKAPPLTWRGPFPLYLTKMSLNNDEKRMLGLYLMMNCCHSSLRLIMFSNKEINIHIVIRMRCNTTNKN